MIATLTAKAEVTVWEIFFLSDAERQWESGLVGWVYQVDPTATLNLDWTLSRRLAAELAADYRSPPKHAPDALRKMWDAEREIAARALQAFADKRCITQAEGSR
jgi:hypothetical protein